MNNNTTIINTTIPTAKRQFCFTVFDDKSIDGIRGVALQLTFILEIVFIIIPNILLIYGLLKTKKTFSTVQRLLIFLHILDLSVGMFVAPIHAIVVGLSSIEGCTLLQAQAFVIVFFPLMAGFVLTLLCFIRYHEIAHTKLHKTVERKGFVYAVIVASTLLSLIFAIWYAGNRKNADIMSHIYFFITVGSCSTVSLLIIMITNTMLITFVSKSTKNNPVLKNVGRNRKNVTKAIILMLTSIAICYVPFLILFISTGVLLLQINQDALNTIYIILPWTQVPVLLSSGLNSLIYITQTKTIIRFYKSLLRS